MTSFFIKFFNRKSLFKIIIIFSVGFAFRVFLYLCLNVNVVVDFLHYFSLLYYLFMGFFIVLINDILNLPSINLDALKLSSREASKSFHKIPLTSSQWEGFDNNNNNNLDSLNSITHLNASNSNNLNVPSSRDLTRGNGFLSPNIYDYSYRDFTLSQDNHNGDIRFIPGLSNRNPYSLPYDNSTPPPVNRATKPFLTSSIPDNNNNNPLLDPNINLSTITYPSPNPPLFSDSSSINPSISEYSFSSYNTVIKLM
jgi:hypothetical protein